MSHQFSFLQAFVGYDSLGSQLLMTFRRNYMFKILPVGLQVRRYRPIGIILLADMSEFLTQVCQRSMYFGQVSLYRSVLARATLAEVQCNLTFSRPKLLNNRYIQRLNKILNTPKSDCGHGDIYNSYIVIWLCNKLLQKIGLLNKQKVFRPKCGLMSQLQLNFNCLKQWRVERNTFYHQSFKFLHAHN